MRCKFLNTSMKTTDIYAVKQIDKSSFRGFL